MQRKSSPMWEYLTAKGVLETGNKEAIAQAKKEWRRVYDTRYKAERRKRLFQHVVSLQPKEHEKVKKAARDHDMSIAEFLKESSLANVEQVCIPDVKSIRKIEALLIRWLSALEEIGRGEKKRGWFARESEVDEMKRIVMALRTEVIREISKPDMLMTAVKNNPGEWQAILNHINHDSKDDRG